jgi:hypothetical protein
MSVVVMQMDEDLAEFLVKDCTSNIELATIVANSVGDPRQQRAMLTEVDKFRRLREIALGALGKA